MAPLPAEGRQPDKPWAAKWCWTSKYVSRPWNQYAYFRRAFELTGKPKSAVVRVSADARYTLYANGRRIHQGPARAYPDAYGFDELDIAPALVEGLNTLCAVVHQFGVSTFFSVYRDASGFILDGAVELDEGDAVTLHTPEGWLARPAAGWKKDVSRLTIQLGFQEHFDAGEDPADWMAPEFIADEATGWATPHEQGPVGRHPWLKLEPRSAPLLADHLEDFVAVTAQFSGDNARGSKIADDVYRLAASEQRKKAKDLIENPAAMLRDGGDAATIPPPGDGKFVMAVLDLGRTRTGHIMLDIAEAVGDEIIDVLYAEAADKSGAPLLITPPEGKPPSVCEHALADRYRCRAGAQQWEAFHMKGLRYAALVFRNVEKPLKVRRVALRQVHADVNFAAASFDCSDKLLNDIWRVGRDTQLNCMLDAYVDCPWREQAMWWGDARVQFRNNAYAFGDVSLFERGIRLLARSQAADGSLHAHPPADVPHHRLPDFMLTWVSSLWDHHLYTNRIDLLSDCLPAMHRLFDFFSAHELRDGLIGGFDGWWVFLDWADLPKGDFSAPLNLMYLSALRHAASICDRLGIQPDANRYIQKAAALQASVERHFFDPKTRTWRDGFDPAAGTVLDSVSQHTNTLAVLLGLQPEAQQAIARDLLLKPARSRRGKTITASPYFYAFVLEALAATGYRQHVVEIIRDKWGAMVEKGATTFWEVWEPQHESRCHAWSASPVYHLGQQVLGVTPTSPGWSHVRIAPITGKLDYARGAVPSPLGSLRVDWEKAGDDQLVVRVELPAGMTGDFIDPVSEKPRPLPAGVSEFHT